MSRDAGCDGVATRGGIRDVEPVRDALAVRDVGPEDLRALGRETQGRRAADPGLRHR